MTTTNVFWSTGHGSYLHRWEQSSQQSWLHALPGYRLWSKSLTRLVVSQDSGSVQDVWEKATKS